MRRTARKHNIKPLKAILPYSLKNNDRRGHKIAPGGLFYLGVKGALLIAFLGLLLMNAQKPTSAQQTTYLTVQSPDLSQFPTISLQFKITDPAGSPPPNLQAAQWTLFEDNIARPVETLTQTYQGVHFTLAINTNRELDLRDNNGVSRYEKMAQVLTTWGTAQAFKANDSWSLTTNEGVQVRRGTRANVWLSALAAYQPNFRALESDLSSLETAVQTAAETVVPFGVDKVLLYLTPPPTPEQIPALYALAEQARADAIHINIWMVGDEYYLANDQGKALQDLAALTGGQFFTFTGDETLPNPADYLAPHGSTYHLTYTSRISETGTYPLSIQAALPNLELSGEAQPFYIDVQPPTPIFIAPPASLTRLADPYAADPISALVPKAYLLEILVQFPDGHPRELRTARLYVDGRLEDENNAFPYDTFIWDLSDETESGEHLIQVVVVDELGLEGSTITTPVQIEVRLPNPKNESPAGFFQNSIFLAAGGGILGIGGLILAVWGLRRVTQRRNAPPLRRRISGRAGAAGTHGVNPGETPAPPLAILEPLDDILPTENQAPLDITRAVTIFGGDPQKVTTPLSDETVSPAHARLTFLNGRFWLRDLDSLAGTWVNHQQIGTQDVPLQSGDLIHFGWLGYRITIEASEESPPKKPIRVSPYEPSL